MKRLRKRKGLPLDGDQVSSKLKLVIAKNFSYATGLIFLE